VTGDRLDCTTPIGQAWIARQRAIVAYCSRAWQVDAASPADDSDSVIDALFSRAGRLLAVGEVKARNLTIAELHAHGSYLVTFDKLVIARDVGARLRVPFVLIVGLVDAVVFWQVADPAGRWLVDMRINRTTTQATCNGGDAVRANAYLSLDDMRYVNP
jgi:hypothetical protein